MLMRAVARLANQFGYYLLDARAWNGTDGLYSLHSARFLADPRFQTAYRRGVQASAGHDPRIEWRAHIALWAATIASRLPGDFVECGVNAGFLSSAILTWLDWSALGKTFYLVDTFAGPPLEQYSPDEIARGRLDVALRAIETGGFVTDIDRVRTNYREWPRVEIVQGAIPAILPAVTATRIAFLHIDMNSAAPEVAALRHFWPRLSPGAVVLLDDYAFCGYGAQGDAMDALAAELGATIGVLPTGQGLMVR
jgi:hypothetical protein